MVEVVDSTILPVSSVSVCSRAQALRAVQQQSTFRHLLAELWSRRLPETSDTFCNSTETADQQLDS